MPLSHVVTAADTANALGSGDVSVLATPRLIAWLEAATVDACPLLGADETSVGTRVDIEHLAATPLGARVDAHAEVVHRDGRLLRFAVTAHHDAGDGPVLIAQGLITRVVVRRDPFLARAIPPVLIREAVAEEWPTIGELCVDAYARGSGFLNGTDGYAHVMRDVPARAAQSTVLVALTEGRVLGTVTVVEPGTPLAEVAREGELEFRFMAVRPDAWRSGVGRILVEAVIARAGERAVACCVIDGNEPAAALYEALGFQRELDRDRTPVPDVRLRAYVRPGQ